MLSPTALETKLIASYDAGSDGSLLPTLSPISQTSCMGYASPLRDGRPFSRDLLSPLRTGGDVSCGSGARSHAGSSGSLEASNLSHSPLSPLPRSGSGGGVATLHLHEKAWASPVKGGGDSGLGKTRFECEEASRGMPTPFESPRGRDWKTALGDSERRFFATAARACDAASMVTPREAREMAKQSTRAKEERQSPPSRSDSFEWWGRGRAMSWGRDQRNAAHGSSNGGRSSWTGDNERDETNAHETAFTPSDGGDRNPEYSRIPRAPNHTTPSPATSLSEKDADDTLMAAASLVSFQKPRLAEAPRLLGPLGTSALRVTLGTPVVSSGASISSSVQARLSLPRTAPTPSYSSLASTTSGNFSEGSADPMETAYRAAGLALGSSGGVRGEGSSRGSGTAPKAVKSGPSSLKSARNGMFDAVSPTAPVEESGTPYSVCRIDRSGRPDTTPAVTCAGQVKGGGSRGVKVEKLTGDGAATAAAAGTGSAHGSVEPLCHTPLRPGVAGREGAPAAGSASARPAGWPELGAEPWATPPPMAMGTPCSGSRFRSADDEESDYSDYETVRA